MFTFFIPGVGCRRLFGYFAGFRFGCRNGFIGFGKMFQSFGYGAAAFKGKNEAGFFIFEFFEFFLYTEF